MKLSEAQWSQLSAHLDRGLELPADERAAWLARLPGLEPGVKVLLGELLARDLSGSSANAPGTLPRLAEFVGDNAAAVPSSVAGYKILRVIGEGGMGTVYEAEQEQPRRVVALKVMKPGRRTPELLRRFAQESQSLARLQHPGVAQIYEAGVTDTGVGPRPWFAMEYIRGLPLPEFAKARRLNTAQRVALMIMVCDAVHHAHQRGIIHRDLKPANILVDEGGQAKVLDFGVARMTGADAELAGETRAGDLVGTLACMSPEQLMADPLEVDARSDVYSLGVLLYELLAGRMPYRLTGGLPQAIRAIREEEPARLGAVVKSCRGDLETIAAKALAKDKDRRYGSAADLAADLRRYLANEPVLARAPGTAYQLRKFAMRHKALAAASAAVLAALSLGLVATLRENVRANRAEQSALLERDRARKAGKTAEDEREKAERERNHAVEEALRADNEAASAKAVSDVLQHDLLGLAGPRIQFGRLGEGKTTTFNPELTVRAALDRAAAGIAGKFASQPVVEAAIRQTIGYTYSDLGLLKEAELQVQMAVVLRTRALGRDHQDTLASMTELGQIYAREGNYGAAEKVLREAWDGRRRTVGERAPQTLETLSGLANAIAKSRGDHGQALALLTQAGKLQASAEVKEGADSLALAHNLATEYTNAGKYAQAAGLYRKVLDSKLRLLGPNHPSTLSSMSGLAVAERNMGRYKEAEALLSDVVRAKRTVLGAGHPETIVSLRSLGLLYQAEGRLDEATRLLEEAARMSAEVSGQTHPDTLAAMNSVAELYRRQKRLPESEALFRQVLEARRHSLAADHPFVTSVLASLGWISLENREYAEAEVLLREALDGQRRTSPDTWRRYYTESMLGGSLAGLGRIAEAELLLNSGLQGMLAREDSMPFENRDLVAEARSRLTGVASPVSRSK